MSDRPRYITREQMHEPAVAFVRAIGTQNAKLLQENLRLTVRQSDALWALDAALAQEADVVDVPPADSSSPFPPAVPPGTVIDTRDWT